MKIKTNGHNGTTFGLIIPLILATAITTGLSACIYLAYWGYQLPSLAAAVGVVTLWVWIAQPWRVWALAGFGVGVAWFYWIGLSMLHYRVPWATGIVIAAVGVVYGAVFGFLAYGAERLGVYARRYRRETTWILKAFIIYFFSAIHPLGFDWFKPELIFVQSTLGVAPWHLGVILTAVIIARIRGHAAYLLIALAAYDPARVITAGGDTATLSLVSTRIDVHDKWDRRYRKAINAKMLAYIDEAIARRKRLVVLPESAFATFLERDRNLLAQLRDRARRITIITGALSYREGAAHNVAFIFRRDGTYTIAPKVVLVPFGETNPLPGFASKWVNRLFYDGAVDYVAAAAPTDVMIEGAVWRSAICYEATSMRLYDPPPKQMVVLSNNGWFVPSIEPTLQRLLLSYYVRRFGTTIYHAANMSEAYILRPL